jgi:endonuclease III related protein
VRKIAIPLPLAYRLLRERFGHQRWWPAQSPFEVCVGAILVQNTTWVAAEKALQRIRTAGSLSPDALHQARPLELQEWIRPAGFPVVKSRRLRAFLDVLCADFGADIARMLSGDTPIIRQRLLAIPGIGHETADCMLLYAGSHPSFVIDAYTRRVFERHGWWAGAANAATYATLQRLCASLLPARSASERVDLWGDFHAQMVAVGKTHCRASTADCANCPLRSLLPPDGPLNAPARSDTAPGKPGRR